MAEDSGTAAPTDEFGLDPEKDYDDVAPCNGHTWGAWGWNYYNTFEIRFCTVCGEMEQQWIASEHTP